MNEKMLTGDLSKINEEKKLSLEYEKIYQKIRNQLGDIKEDDNVEIYNKLKKIEEKNGEIESEEIRKTNITKLSDVLSGEDNLEITNKFIDAILDLINQGIEEQNTIVEKMETKEEEPEKELSVAEAQENLYNALDSEDRDKIKEALEANPFGIKKKDISTEDFDNIESLLLKKYENELVKLNNQTETGEIIEKKDSLRKNIKDIIIRIRSEELEELRKELEEEDKKIILEKKYLKELKEEKEERIKKIIIIKRDEIEKTEEKISGIKDNIDKITSEIEDTKEEYKT